MSLKALQDRPIAIAGAGIGGLTAALCLACAGRRVAVLERAPRIEEVGAGLQIAPNAGRILQQLGLVEALRAAAFSPEAINVLRACDGARLARLPLGEAERRWGAPFRLFHRADLQQLLLQAAARNALIEIRANARVCDVEEEEGVAHLRLQCGASFEDVEASALICADGARSALRARLVPGEADAPRYSGHTAWRALLPEAAIPAPLRKAETHLWLGEGAHVVHYPLRDGSIHNAVVLIEDGGASAPVDPATRRGDEVLRAASFSRAAPELRALIEACEEWRRWPLYARPKLKRWSYGAVALLGDAAHPMLPYLAQGAAQAIEDAEALGAAFGAHDDPAQALQAYEKTRVLRAGKVQSASRRQGFYFHAGAPLSFARDIAIRLLGGQGMLSRNDWLYR